MTLPNSLPLGVGRDFRLTEDETRRHFSYLSGTFREPRIIITVIRVTIFYFIEDYALIFCCILSENTKQVFMQHFYIILISFIHLNLFIHVIFIFINIFVSTLGFDLILRNPELTHLKLAHFTTVIHHNKITGRNHVKRKLCFHVSRP